MSVIPVEAVTQPHLINDGRAEAVNVLNSDQPVIQCVITAEAWQVGSSATKTRKHEVLRTIGNESCGRKKIARQEMVIDLDVTVVLLESRYRRSRVVAV